MGKSKRIRQKPNPSSPLNSSIFTSSVTALEPTQSTQLEAYQFWSYYKSEAEIRMDLETVGNLGDFGRMLMRIPIAEMIERNLRESSSRSGAILVACFRKPLTESQWQKLIQAVESFESLAEE